MIRVLLGALLTVALAPGSAGATTVAVDGPVLRYTAAVGWGNHPMIRHEVGRYVLYEAGISAGLGCAREDVNQVLCADAGITSIVLAVLDNFTVRLAESIAVPVTVNAPPGSRGGVSYFEERRPVRVSLDGLANDGPASRGDNVAGSDVEGGRASDVLTGDEGANHFYGGWGDDVIATGAGDDTVQAASYDDIGGNTGFSSDGHDTVTCGTGLDKVYADAGDRVARDCEQIVSVRDAKYPYVFHGGAGPDAFTTADGSGTLVFGGGGDDRLAGNNYSSDRLYGQRGNDWLAGYGRGDVLDGGTGDDHLSGGAGNDRLIGHGGHDVLDGETGNDTINARDGRHDVVRCGSGNDRVTADHRDRVARDCERVTRR